MWRWSGRRERCPKMFEGAFEEGFEGRDVRGGWLSCFG